MIKRAKKNKEEEMKEDVVEESTKVEVTVDNGTETPTAEAVDPLEALRAKNAELEERLLRSLADFENYKKRTARQYDVMMATANDRLLGDLLEVMDNFERAVAHDNGTDGENSDEGFRQGITMIHNQMRGLLERYNVTPIESVGQPFDANLHEAFMSMASDEYAEGIVVSEISKGYRIGERVLRHSRVAVSTGPATDRDDDTSGRGNSD